MPPHRVWSISARVLLLLPLVVHSAPSAPPSSSPSWAPKSNIFRHSSTSATSGGSSKGGKGKGGKGKGGSSAKCAAAGAEGDTPLADVLRSDYALHQLSDLVDLVLPYVGNLDCFTLICPTDEAFNVSDSSSEWGYLLPTLLDDADWSLHLESVLKHHVIPDEALLEADLIALEEVPTFLGEVVQIHDDPFAIGLGRVLESGLAPFSVIHVVDTVLPPSWVTKSLLDRVHDDEDLSLFAELLEASELDLSVAGAFTLFAPTDAALEALDDKTLRDLKKESKIDELRRFIYQHLVPQVHPLSSLSASGLTPATLNHGSHLEIRVNATGVTLVNDVAVIAQADILANNGILHKIDGAVIPDKPPKLSRFGKEFVKETFIPGLAMDADEYVEMIEGEPYTIQFAATAYHYGIVSLRAVKEEIDSVVCLLFDDENAAVSVTFKEDVDDDKEEELALLFPPGAILYVDSQEFGLCDFETADILPLPPNETRAEFVDGYMFISHARLRDDDVTVDIVGVPSDFWTTYQRMRGSIKHTPNATDSGVTRRLNSISGGFSRTYPLGEIPFGSFVLMGTWRLKFSVDVEFDWGWVWYEFVIPIDYEAQFELEATLQMNSGTLTYDGEWPLISLRLPWSIPKFLIRIFGGQGPASKLGFYLEAPINLKAESQLFANVGMKITETLFTGERIVMVMRSTLLGPRFSVRSEGGTPAEETEPTAEYLSTPVLGAGFKFDFFVGLKPQLALYIGPKISATIPFGVGIDVKSLWNLIPFPAETDDSPPLLLGVCDQCHSLQHDLNFRAGDIIPAFETEKIKLGPLTFEPVQLNIVLTGAIEIPIAKVCFFPDDSCPTDPSPTRSPSLPPSSPPTPSPVGRPRAPTWPRRTTGIFGDPHLSTFDRVRFDCQAAGEFITVTSLEDPNLMVQERFTAVGSDACSQASVSTGIAIREDHLPVVQFSIPQGNTTGSEEIAGCPVDYYVGHLRTNFSTVLETDEIEVSVTPPGITVLYPFTGLRVVAVVRNAATFGCFFRLVQVSVPFSYRANETVLGLLGTPNGVRSDDWRDRSGAVYTLPATEAESIFSRSYNYCVTNWCVHNESDSIFTYGDDASWEDIYKCNETYQDEIESAVASAPTNLTSVCGTDLFCLVDGICGNLEDSTAVLEDEATVLREQEEGDPSPSAMPTFTTLPSSVPSDAPSDIPSRLPSDIPSTAPSDLPSVVPSDSPSQVPSTFPSIAPSSGKGKGKGGSKGKR